MSAALVTGANRGIGLELCRQLKKRGSEVIAVCRTSCPELDALGVDVHTGIEVTSAEAIDSLKQALEGRPIDLLVSCAGILRLNTIDSLNFESIREQIEVNSLGPLRITSALIDNLQKNSKVAIITSRMGSISDNSSGGSYGYRMSKAALNMAGKSLAIDLKPQGIAVALLHPGFVRTDMTQGKGLIDTVESASGLLQQIDELTLETSGGFWHQNGESIPW